MFHLFPRHIFLHLQLIKGIKRRIWWNKLLHLDSSFWNYSPKKMIYCMKEEFVKNEYRQISKISRQNFRSYLNDANQTFMGMIKNYTKIYTYKNYPSIIHFKFCIKMWAVLFIIYLASQKDFIDKWISFVFIITKKMFHSQSIANKEGSWACWYRL